MIIKNKILPPKGFKAIAIFPFIFTRKEKLSDIEINHEMIHLRQQKELLIIPFYLLYCFCHLRFGYNKNPFEVEAYKNGSNLNYLKKRKSFSWLKYST